MPFFESFGKGAGTKNLFLKLNYTCFETGKRRREDFSVAFFFPKRYIVYKGQ